MFGLIWGIVLGDVINIALDEIGFDIGPTTLEKVDMLFTDAETEGKKQGYTRAADEYTRILESLEKEYASVICTLRGNRHNAAEKMERLCEKLQDLTRTKDKLAQEADRKADRFSMTFGVPVCEVKQCIAGPHNPAMPAITFGALDLVYRSKQRKLAQAEQKGYVEAKQEFEKKTAKLRAELRQIIEKSQEEMREYAELCEDILNETARVKAQIAEFNILLRTE